MEAALGGESEQLDQRPRLAQPPCVLSDDPVADADGEHPEETDAQHLIAYPYAFRAGTRHRTRNYSEAINRLPTPAYERRAAVPLRTIGESEVRRGEHPPLHGTGARVCRSLGDALESRRGCRAKLLRAVGERRRRWLCARRGGFSVGLVGCWRGPVPVSGGLGG